jgi:serine O-acetyltransferase
MSIREKIDDYSKGNDLHRFWLLFRRREQTKSGLRKKILTFHLNRIAHRHGGYIGNGAVIRGVPSLPHGLHGIYVSRYAVVGEGCRIYQNVTIGEVSHRAPEIGDNCLIGAGAVLVGGIQIGSNVKIGAGAVLSTNVPDNCTVVSQPPRIITRGES